MTTRQAERAIALSSSPRVSIDSSRQMGVRSRGCSRAEAVRSVGAKGCSIDGERVPVRRHLDAQRVGADLLPPRRVDVELPLGDEPVRRHSLVAPLARSEEVALEGHRLGTEDVQVEACVLAPQRVEVPAHAREALRPDLLALRELEEAADAAPAEPSLHRRHLRAVVVADARRVRDEAEDDARRLAAHPRAQDDAAVALDGREQAHVQSGLRVPEGAAVDLQEHREIARITERPDLDGGVGDAGSTRIGPLHGALQYDTARQDGCQALAATVTDRTNPGRDLFGASRTRRNVSGVHDIDLELRVATPHRACAAALDGSCAGVSPPRDHPMLAWRVALGW